MKILSLIDVFSFIPAGGAGTYLFETCKRFVKEGHSVVVVCRRRKDIPLDGFFEGVKFLSFDVAKPQAFDSLFVGLRKLMSIISKVTNEFCPDVVYGHHSIPLNVFNSLKKTKKISIVYVFHSPWHKEYITRRFGLVDEGKIPYVAKKLAYLRKKSDERALKKSDIVVTLSEYMCQEAQKISLCVKEKNKIIPGGADEIRFNDSTNLQEARKKLGIDEKFFVVSTVRSLIPRTGVDKLLETAKIVAQKIPEFRLVICGDGIARKKLEEYTKSNGLSNVVQFEGAVLNENLPVYYQASDLFVMPSQELEGFGLALIEAMMCGTPSIVTPVGGMPQIIKKFDERFITKNPSPQSIAEKILEFYHSLRYNINLRKRCRDFAIKNYTWNDTSKRLIEVFNEVIWKKKNS